MAAQRAGATDPWLPSQPGRIAKQDRPEACDGSSGKAEAKELTHISGRAFLLAAFAKAEAFYDAGDTVTAITRRLRFSRKTVDNWVRLEALPERARIPAWPCTPARFATYLRERWAGGEKNVRRLLLEGRAQGYTGCYSRLAAFIAKWRQESEVRPAPRHPTDTLPLDPRTGTVISPIVAAALCIKPGRLLTLRQAEMVDILKQELPMFSGMRSMAMRFRGLLRGKRTTALDDWIRDAIASGIHAMRRFGFNLRHDIDAVRNAIGEKWSNGQTEGQINRLKALKRAMYGRASIPLLYARIRPLHELASHQICARPVRAAD